MTPEDEIYISMVRVRLGDSAENDTGELLRIIDDLRGELHGYQAAAEEEARAVDEQVATSDEHRERCEAWERRAKSLEIELSQIADLALQTIKLVPMRKPKRKAYQWCATCIGNAIANVNEHCPEPKENKT